MTYLPVAERYQVTEWMNPDEYVISGQWGTLHAKYWLQVEADRWAAKGRDAWLQISTGDEFYSDGRRVPPGQVALFTHRDENIKAITNE